MHAREPRVASFPAEHVAMRGSLCATNLCPGYHGMQTMNVSLTDNARKVLDQAQVEARQLNQEFVGTEHVLLALLHVSGTQAGRILRQQHVDRDALRSRLL